MPSAKCLKPTMKESQLLAHIYERSADLTSGMAGEDILVGPGDDCAVLAGGLLVTVDQLVEGRHYKQDATIDAIARKAVYRAISDISAMGGAPMAGFASAAIRRGESRDNQLFDRMAHWAMQAGCPLAGGDISSVDGPTVLSLTILGRAHGSRGPVLRSTAKAGDTICVTGAVGGAVTSARHLRPPDRLPDTKWLCDTLGDRLTSMIDLSDGLGIDASRVGRASGTLMSLDAPRIPLNEDAKKLDDAIAEGEDYELLFTVSGEFGAESVPQTGTPLTRIGVVKEGEPGSELVNKKGNSKRIDTRGWDHTG